MIDEIFQVNNGAPVYSGKFNDQLTKLCAENESKTFNIQIKAIKDAARYHQHKHYRGDLLPIIAREAYDGIELKAHIELKKMFLLRRVSCWTEIPKKHYDRITVFTKETATGEDIYAYVPSLAVLTKDEFDEYIHEVQMLIVEMGL